LGADGIATGHYVRLDPTAPNGPALQRGADSDKDQAYFLWGLPRHSLPLLHFPLGDLTKPGVRKLAREMGLITADKPESQEICFVPTGDYRDLLRSRMETAHPALQPGSIVTSGGAVVGTHSGYAGFTVGQRKGLPGGFSEAMFVMEIRPAKKEVVVGTAEELLSTEVELGGLNWLVPADQVGPAVEVQLRHRARPAPARIETRGDSVLLRLTDPQRAVTPGQSGVLFDGERVLGGGRILRTW
jgi:tRNA-specific 2-thiouridylase